MSPLDIILLLLNCRAACLPHLAPFTAWWRGVFPHRRLKRIPKPHPSVRGGLVAAASAELCASHKVLPGRCRSQGTDYSLSSALDKVFMPLRRVTRHVLPCAIHEDGQRPGNNRRRKQSKHSHLLIVFQDTSDANKVAKVQCSLIRCHMCTCKSS